jgi:hypothetical protein
MAELVDALDSKSGYRKVVQVRFLFWARFKSSNYTCGNCFFCAQNSNLALKVALYSTDTHK